MKLIEYCIYIYILLKPFYITKSGNMQISDLFILIAFFLMLFIKKKEKTILIEKIKPLVIFIAFVCAINFLYYLIYETTDFLISAIQYVYIAMGVYVYYNIIEKKNIIIKIDKILKIDILIQMIIYIIGAGRYFGIDRYMGTFNDPNQFAFFIFLSLMIITTIQNIYNIKSKTYWLYFLIGTFLIIESASTGMILGMIVFMGLSIVCNLKKYVLGLRIYIFPITMGVLVISLIIGIIITLYYGDSNFKEKVNDKITECSESLFYQRIVEKVNKLDTENEGTTFIQDRCLDKIILYPENIIFGAGQGNYKRFDKALFYNHEIHSTLPSILFYYGIIPFLILLYWIYTNIKGLKFNQYIPYIAILIESFTLLNQRQLLLWFLIILANEYKRKRKDEKNAESINNYGNI